MYVISKIKDEDFHQLAILHWSLKQLLPNKLSKVQSAFVLLGDITRDTAIFSGIYYKNKLVGFVSGFGLKEDTFYVANIYVEKKHRFKVKELLEYMEKLIKESGYKRWMAESYLKEGKRMITHFGAKEIYNVSGN